MRNIETKYLEIERECPSCEGTGLYIGMAERGGFAIVCHTCKGLGRDLFKLKYREFSGRRLDKDKRVLRVLQTNPGYVVAPDVTPGGVTLDEWRADPSSPKRAGAELREQTCPAWWYQSADNAKKPDWDECNDSIGARFSHCPHFSQKRMCWLKWDAQQKDKP